MRAIQAGAIDERGLGLVEILVAIAIIAIGLVGLAIVHPVASFAVQDGNQRSTATVLAVQRLEETRGAAWAADTDCIGLSPSPTLPPVTTTSCDIRPGEVTTFPDEASVGAFPDYSRTVRILDCSSGSGCAGIVDPDVRLVTVTVRYRPMSAVGGTPMPPRGAVVLDLLVARR